MIKTGQHAKRGLEKPFLTVPVFPVKGYQLGDGGRRNTPKLQQFRSQEQAKQNQTNSVTYRLRDCIRQIWIRNTVCI